MAFGLARRGLRAAEVRQRVEEMLELVRLGDFGRRAGPAVWRPASTSRWRVRRQTPKLLLLDEPLGAPDRKLREHTQFELVNIQERLGITFIAVTHDQEEAMTMSTRMAVMNEGRIRQIGTPSEIYEFPEQPLRRRLYRCGQPVRGARGRTAGRSAGARRTATAMRLNCVCAPRRR